MSKIPYTVSLGTGPVPCYHVIMNKGTVRIGTSGWHYAHWKGPFYPENMPATRFLEYYITRFNTVEINNTFYHMPNEKTFNDWRSAVTNGFIFAVKASRFITHMKKLKDAAEPLRHFMDAVAILGDTLGPVLFQLPPRWSPNIERLDEFLSHFPKDRRAAFEFRDDRWHCNEVYDILKHHNAALCIYDYEGRIAPLEVTADFVYVRLHGPEKVAYAGNYSKQALGAWAKRIAAWTSDGLDVFCYFDNDEAAYAALDAATLIGLVKKRK